jgi:integrase
MADREKIPVRHINIEREVKRVSGWDIAEEDKKLIPRYIRDLELGIGTGNIIVPGTVLTYITNLRTSLEFFKKPVSKLKSADTERLHEALLKDTLKWLKKKKIDGITKESLEPYAKSSKTKIRDSAISYLNWRLKDKADILTKVLKIKDKQILSTPDYLSEQECEKLFSAAPSNELKFFISVMFDLGSRCEEFHNLRLEDIHLPKKDENFVRITIKTEYSKTEGRTVSLYWKHSLKAVTDYVEERKRDGIRETEPIFKTKCKTIRRWLKEFGNQILGRNLYYHLFRHSSATYYANHLDRHEICYRYGWKYRSPMPDRYINREGAQNKKLDVKFERTKMGELQEHIEKIEYQSKLKDEEVKQLKFQVQLMVHENKKMVEQFNEAVTFFKRLNVTENY